MKKSLRSYVCFILVLCFLSLFVACGGGGGGGGGAEYYPVYAVINEDTHEITLNLHDDFSVAGVIADHALFANDMKKICYNSDPDGWLADATACGDFVWDGSKTVKATVVNTSNSSEKGNWTLIDRNETVFWFDPGTWHLSGRDIKVIPAVKDQLGNIDGPYVKYGKPIKPTISIVKDGNSATMTVDFGINKFDWMSSRFVEDNLIVFKFQSDFTGWLSECWAFGVLSKDNDGDWIVTITGLPLGDVYGNVSADLVGGVISWTAPELWNYEGNVNMAKDPANANVWLIKYSV